MADATVPAGQLGPALTGNAAGQTGPGAGEFFARLLHGLDHDYPVCATLIVLLSMQADLGFVPASRRDIAAALGCAVSDRHIGRALQALEAQGLVERRSHPNTTSRYRVIRHALRALLEAPTIAAEVIPGLSPLPALDRLFADATAQDIATTAEGQNHE
jgi:DNA-binding MarR family transcriptional regulator